MRQLSRVCPRVGVEEIYSIGSCDRVALSGATGDDEVVGVRSLKCEVIMANIGEVSGAVEVL